MKTSNLLLGALVGVTVGAIAGILFAPKKGSVTRRFIAQKGSDYMGDMRDKFNDSLANVNHKIDSLKQEVKNMVKKGFSKTEEELNRTSSSRYR